MSNKTIKKRQSFYFHFNKLRNRNDDVVDLCIYLPLYNDDVTEDDE